ncbi:MAG TPA: choloylglycine hydrolase [Firmicutes bacterium]|nr:choloylglycine hydrolase [Bacillota bacterium]
MCTAITYEGSDFYFGRNLDYDFSYGEEVVITPRGFALSFKNASPLKSHHAIIGMAHVENNYPLYYDAINEKGLGIAGLNFVKNACYYNLNKRKINIASFELIPWILGQCSSVKEVKKLLAKTNITNIAFSKAYPPSQLHYLIADSTSCIVLECVKEGMKIYDNPIGVLTNNPPFNMQLFNLNNYMGLSKQDPKNTFSKKLKLNTYSRGMGGLGLPGDLSSSSRFIKVAFTKANTLKGENEEESVSQFFHILNSVEQQKGCCEVKKGEFEYTIYSSCCNLNKGIYYYLTYSNHQINAVNMNKENLDSNKLIKFKLLDKQNINNQN